MYVCMYVYISNNLCMYESMYYLYICMYVNMIAFMNACT